MDRDEHLAWCKERALALADASQTAQAVASMNSDLQKHPGTADQAGMLLGMQLLIAGHLDNAVKCRHWIEGFN